MAYSNFINSPAMENCGSMRPKTATTMFPSHTRSLHATFLPLWLPVYFHHLKMNRLLWLLIKSLPQERGCMTLKLGHKRWCGSPLPAGHRPSAAISAPAAWAWWREDTGEAPWLLGRERPVHKLWAASAPISVPSWAALYRVTLQLGETSHSNHVERPLPNPCPTES